MQQLHNENSTFFFFFRVNQKTLTIFKLQWTKGQDVQTFGRYYFGPRFVVIPKAVLGARDGFLGKILEFMPRLSYTKTSVGINNMKHCTWCPQLWHLICYIVNLKENFLAKGGATADLVLKAFPTGSLFHRAGISMCILGAPTLEIHMFQDSKLLNGEAPKNTPT